MSQQLEQRPFCLLGFSKGAQYALAYALKHQKQLSGLILVDSPPVHGAGAPGWTDFWMARTYEGRMLKDFARAEMFAGIEREAVRIEFWEQLSELVIPVRFFRGISATSPIPSNVSEENAARLQSLLPNCREILFKNSGHMIPDDERAYYISQVRAFLSELDGKNLN